MKLDNNQIEAHVQSLKKSFLKNADAPIPVEVVNSVADLITNLLQNINDLAFCAVNKDQRDSQ